MSPSPRAAAHQRERARLAARTARAARTEWRQVEAEDIAGSWTRLLDRAVAVVSAGQLAAGQQAGPWLDRLLGRGAPAEGEVEPRALAGVAGDGRDLAGLLMYPVWVALHRITRGMSIAAALLTGQAFLDLVVRTVVADAGRAADLVGMLARPAVTSYIRVVHLPACARCIILAGAEYGVSTGFRRHPRCDCTMEPVTRAHRPEPASPAGLYEQMPADQRRSTFGAAAVTAIGDGADLAQVVNARRGMTAATTTEGTTRRGIAGRGLGAARRGTTARPRLMPEEIARQATSREHRVELLRVHGYLI